MNKVKDNNGMGSITIRDVEPDLRRAFRMLCLEKRVSMNQAIKDYVAWSVKNKKLVLGSPGLARLEEKRPKR